MTEQKFWYKWMMNYSFGELLGIGAAAIIGRFLFVEFSNAVPSSSVFTPFILTITGAAEGLIIGYVQWKSLSKILIDLKARLWITVTTIATIIGWLLVLPPAILFISFLAKLNMLDNYYTVGYTLLVGIGFGGIVGTAQFFVIKKFYTQAIVWVFANTFGWMLSFIIVYVALAMFDYSTSFYYNFLLIMIACVLSGLVQGIVTGTSLHFLMSVKKGHNRKHIID